MVRHSWNSFSNVQLRTRPETPTPSQAPANPRSFFVHLQSSRASQMAKDNERKRSQTLESEVPRAEQSTSAAASESKKQKLLPSLIKNKEKRSQVHAKLKKEKKIEKRRQAKARDAAHKRALELGEEAKISPFSFFPFCVLVVIFAVMVWFLLENLQPPEKKVPRTIENAREPDETVCQPDDEEVLSCSNFW